MTRRSNNTKTRLFQTQVCCLDGAASSHPFSCPFHGNTDPEFVIDIYTEIAYVKTFSIPATQIRFAN